MANRKQMEERKGGRQKANFQAAQQAVMTSNDFSCLRLPEGVTQVKLDGNVTFDFMQYRVGKGNPRCDEGFDYHEREFYQHRVEGPYGAKVVTCRKETFGTPCAVCDYVSRHGTSLDKETKDSLRPQKKHMWLVTQDFGAKKPKVQVLVTSSTRYTRKDGFMDLINDAIEEAGLREPFSDPEHGKTVVLTVKEKSFTGKTFKEPTRVSFKDRAKQYDPNIPDLMPCLDDMIIDPGYDEVKRLLTAVGDDEDDDEVEDETPVSRNGRRPAPVEDDEDDEEDERPARGRAQAPRKPVEGDEDEDEEESQEEEELAGGDDEEGDEEEPEPASTGFKVGDTVEHKHFVCKVTKVSADGKTLNLEDEDGDPITKVPASSCKPYSKKKK